MAALDDWVQLDDAVKVSGRSKPTVYRWISEGRVRTLKPGKVIWVNLEDLRKAKADTRRGRPPKNNSIQ